MKANCKSLKLSIILSTIFIICTITLSIIKIEYKSEVIEIILNISIGLFGSSFVALLLNIPTYIVSKRQLLEKFYNESSRLISRFDKVDYLLSIYDKGNVINYINALKNKKWVDEYNKLNPKNKIDSKEKKYKKLLIEEYVLNSPNLKDKISKSGLKNFANEQVDIYIEKLRNKANKIFKQYIKLAKESTIELDFMLGDMKFLSGIKPYKKIHTKIYQPLFEMLNEIKEQCYHFNLYLQDEGNESICIEKLFNLQKKLFDLSIEEDELEKKYIVTSKFIDNMLIDLEEYRADMYNIKPEKIKIYPALVKSYKKR